jgi:hypothetical protein
MIGSLALALQKVRRGRGSRIRTCDLKYPKLPRYQAAPYPGAARPLDTRFGFGQQAANRSDHGAKSRWVDIERQVDLEISHSGHEIAIEGAAALTVEKPANKEFRRSTLQSDPVEEAPMRHQLVNNLTDGRWEFLVEELAFNECLRPKRLAVYALQRRALRCSSRLPHPPSSAWIEVQSGRDLGWVQ